MSDKTDKYVPKFYLYHQDQPLCITKPMILGRTIGDIILDNPKLSSKHCAFIPRLLDLYVMDLDSSNGVFVNKQKIFPNEEVKLVAGDEIRIGNMDYLVFDSEEKYKLHIQKQKLQSHPVSSGFHLSDLFTFFHVSKGWRALYSLSIIVTIGSLMFHSKLGIPLGDDLKFLNETYSEFLILNGLRSVLIVWGLCLFHAYLVKVYFSRHGFHGAMSTMPLLIAIVYVSNIQYGPAGFLKQYVEVRHAIVEPTQESKAINQLKKLTDSQEMLVKHFPKINSKLNQDQKKVFEADNSKVLAMLSKQINKVKPEN